MASIQSLPPVKACLFDMDGLLINTEDIYTDVTNTILRDCGRPDLPWNVKAQLQGRPGPEAVRIFMEWAKLPISITEYQERQIPLQKKYFPTCGPLPGVPELLETLAAASPASAPSEKVEIALATSSATGNFLLKTAHLQDLFSVFPKSQQVTGDDPRIPKGRGKPAPDIYLVALESINSRRRGEGKEEIKPEECLVFEDAVPGVESGRRAGMRVVWVPHPGLLQEYNGREEEVLAGLMGEADTSEEGHWGDVGESGDGKGELRSTLVGFDYLRYGILTGN
ncbi:HAD superfamily hydrolase [Geopyxis carbonaria]|nr:HAD superfamily hydrolase [Geopyxis carbonaria]